MTQFKIGSMVVHSEGVGIIKRYEPSLVLSPLFVKFEHCSLWIKPSEVKCVRNKPRKGSKEARDIVAMLANEFRLSRHCINRNNRFMDNSMIGIHRENIDMAYHDCAETMYLKAKSMLNEDL